MDARLVLIQALSPLHAGVGQGVGIIDLPIAREKSTQLPYLPGSSIKGVLRAACTDLAARKRVFGPETSNASEHAGAAQFTDATLLMLPVRSLAGTFAWVTSPYILRRLARDLGDLGFTGTPNACPAPTGEERCLVAKGGTRLKADGQRVVLEDLDFEAVEDATLQAWAAWLAPRLFPDGVPQAQAWRDAFVGQVCVVHDDIMTYLLENATEVVARIRLSESTKTVERGALWYEESLPTESILWGMVLAQPVKAGKDGTVVNGGEVFQTLQPLVGRGLQFGGNATIGRGLCNVRLVAK